MPSNSLAAQLQSFAPLILIFVLFYFMMIRPQQKRAKEHQAMLAALKKGDTVVMSSGLIGKVARVDDKEVSVEIAPTVVVKVVKGMIAEVRVRGEPAPANDPKLVS